MSGQDKMEFEEINYDNAKWIEHNVICVTEEGGWIGDLIY
jgi:hypothetical protein